METQAASHQSDADRIAQEQSYKIRDLQKRQKVDLDALTEKHQKEMAEADKAYQVELSSKQDDHARKLSELEKNQSSQIASVMRQGDLNTKQAQETYRMQAEETAYRGEKKLNALREQEMLSEENLNRHVKKGKA